jgi:CO/xanthine dehydrogenase Mo-binding subunit
LLIDGNRAVLPGGEIKPTDLGVCKGSGRGDRRINDSSTDATGKQWSSRSLMKCYDEASERFGWSKRSHQPGSMRHGDWLIGWGCASAVYPTHVGAAAARVRLIANGEARVQIAAHDIGTGAYTVIGQIAAEQLGIPLSSVSVELGDSNLPPAPVAGAMIWGISSALHEATEIDRRNARYVNDNLADYLVPVNADIQDVDVILVPEKDDFVNPVGVKGIGELGNVGTAAAVANAVYHATGIRVRKLPIRLEKLLTA